MGRKQLFLVKIWNELKFFAYVVGDAISITSTRLYGQSDYLPTPVIRDDLRFKPHACNGSRGDGLSSHRKAS